VTVGIDDSSRGGRKHGPILHGGGGGVIVPEEIALLADRGVTIFAPEDGQRLGLPGMINKLIAACDVDLCADEPSLDAVLSGSSAPLARAIKSLQTQLQVNPAK